MLTLNNHGVGLIEVILTSVVVGILLTALGSGIMKTHKFQRGVAMEDQFSLLITNIHQVLENVASCNLTVRDVDLKGGVQSLSILQANGNTIVTTGSNYSGLVVDSILVDPGVPTNNQYQFSILISAHKSGSNGQELIGGKALHTQKFLVNVDRTTPSSICVNAQNPRPLSYVFVQFANPTPVFTQNGYTPLRFDQVLEDNIGEYNAATHVVTLKSSGLFQINAFFHVYPTPWELNNYCKIALLINSVPVNQNALVNAPFAGNGCVTELSTILNLRAGDTIDFRYVLYRTVGGIDANATAVEGRMGSWGQVAQIR